MGQKEKRIERLKTKPIDYTYDEARALLQSLGFEERQKGSIPGSRVLFHRESDNMSILLHKPHPSNEMDVAATKQLLRQLKESGDIK